MDLLRLATAGSVDDGKSTLIGRLLYDAKAVLADQLAHVEERSVNGLDLALAQPLEPELGTIQRLTPTIEALVTPSLEPSLDDAAAKRRFWAAFRALGEWYEALPPY